MHPRTLAIALCLATGAARAQAPEALWYTRNEGIPAFLAHADKISIIAPQTYSLDSNGNLRGRVDPRIIAKAHEMHVKVIPLFTNGGFDQAAFHHVLTVPAAWHKAISSLVTECRDNHYDGWQFDVENVHVRDRDLFTKFVRETVDSLHRSGCKSVSAAVVPRLSDDSTGNNYHRWIFDNWRAAYDYKALADTLDFLSYMTYAQHTGGSTPGPVAGYAWMEECLKFVLSKGAKPNKISLGLASYSDWWFPDYDAAKDASRSRASDIAHARAMQLLQNTHATPAWDDTQKAYWATWETHGVFEHLWIEDARSFGTKAGLVKKYGLRGYSVWVLGTEDPKIWDGVGTVSREPK